jgi:hypothetical protein
MFFFIFNCRKIYFIYIYRIEDQMQESEECIFNPYLKIFDIRHSDLYKTFTNMSF